MTPEDSPQPPKTITELGIHFHYLREDVTDIKAVLAEMSKSAVTRAEFDDYKVEVTEKFENVDHRLTKRSWVQVTLTSLATLVITLLMTYFIANILGA